MSRSFYFVVEWTQEGAKFVYSVSVSTGGGVHWNLQSSRYLVECEVFPKFEMNDSPLFRGEFQQPFGQCIAKSGLIGVVGLRKWIVFSEPN